MLSPVHPGGAVSGASGTSVASVAVSSSGQSSLNGVAAAGVTGTTTSATGTNPTAVVRSGSSVAVGVGHSENSLHIPQPAITDKIYQNEIRTQRQNFKGKRTPKL